MKPPLPSPRGLLVIAPHADDETIGAFGLMLHWRRSGVLVRVLVVSDGAGSHRGSVTWPTPRLVRERQRETQRAMRRIGVTANHISYLGLPDGHLTDRRRALCRGITRAIWRMPDGAWVIAPGLDDDHADHRAVAAVVPLWARPGDRLLTYPAWPAVNAHGRWWRRALDPQQRLAKSRALRGYRTQTGIITDDPLGFAISRAQMTHFCRHYECFGQGRRG